MIHQHHRKNNSDTIRKKITYKGKCYFVKTIKLATVLLIQTNIGFIFQSIGLDEINIYTVFILGILVTAVLTASKLFSIISAVLGILTFNYLFATPYYSLESLNFTYPITFIILIVAAFIMGSITEKNEKQSKLASENAIRAKNEQLRANLLRSISHDLRTPLTSISGNAGVLIKNSTYLSKEKKEQLYTDIYTDSLWLINLVENLLAVSRIEDNKMIIRTNPELLDEIITEALSHIDPNAKEHTIRVEQGDEMLLARIDARLIVQVIINLVDNAIKYTPKGSLILIRTSRKENFLQVEVEDTGEGIRDAEKEKIFEMFYTIQSTSSDGRRGLGLGLALCKAIITAHGGTISVRDNTPKGTIVTFTIPSEEVHIYE